MKTKYLILVWMCMAVSVSMQAQDKQLVILHTNDTHSTIMPLNANLADKEVAGRGGFIRRLDFLRQQRLQNPDLLYFDSGDFSQGSSYYTMFKGDVEIGLMNKMGIDAATIGNHEFDFGMENMARLVWTLSPTGWTGRETQFGGSDLPRSSEKGFGGGHFPERKEKM